MCGIFGIAVRNGHVSPDLLEQATRSLAHRGPDDSGTVIVRTASPEPLEVGLGNRRLAILDLSPGGHQPMQDPETGNWIAYNGELYNFRDIRHKLEREGIRCASHSDTEVLLKAYGRWGERCLSELRGMFAFAIWDARQNRLFVARDPMGIKPLYYYHSGGRLLFASELRTLLETGLLPRRLDAAGLYQYLSFGSLYDPITLIEGVRALRAGYYLIWQGGRLQESRYWDLAPPREVGPGIKQPRSRLESELHEILDESVRMQTVSDVPVGTFLSGGIDSSAVVALLARSGIRVNTFSIVFREADYSEAEYSRAVAKRFRTEHHEIVISQADALATLPSAVKAMDQPTIDGINTYLVSQQTRAAGIKVALSGLGGDELFAGYSNFRDVPRLERFAALWRHVPSPARQPVATAFRALSPRTDQGRKLTALVASNGDLLHPYFLARALFTRPQLNSLCLLEDDTAVQRAEAPLIEALANARHLDPINRVSYLESRCYMLNTLLRDSDAMSMAHGLELRVPLIDHVLAEKLLGVPGPWKLDSRTPKPLLVHPVADALPQEIIYRRKRGFTLPFEHWLRGELRSEVEQGLQRIQSGPLAAVLHPLQAEIAWNDFLQGKTSWSRPWSLYVLQRWCELNSVVA